MAHPDETLRAIAARMISTGVWRVPVVSRANPRQVVGILSQRELLRARERIFRLRMLAPRAQPAAVPEAETTAVKVTTDHDGSRQFNRSDGEGERRAQHGGRIGWRRWISG